MSLKHSVVVLLFVTSAFMQQGTFTYPSNEDILQAMSVVTWSISLTYNLKSENVGTDLVIDCNADSVAVKWRPSRDFVLKVDPSRAHLGTCPSRASAVDEDLLLFSVSLHECGFQRLVGENKVIYTNVLTYQLGAGLSPIVKPVRCDYDISDRRTDSEGMENDLVFNMEFMNNDLSAPASSTMFTLGSRIAIRVEAAHRSDTPVQIYLHSCVLAKTPDLTTAGPLHTLYSDVGCLSESQGGNLTFLPRQKPSEIRFCFQALKFALEEPIFLHCEIMAWDSQTFSIDDNVCHFLQYQKSWEPLGDPGFICSCCDSICIHRSNIKPGISTYKVLGPFTIVDPQNDALDGFWTDEGVPVWVIVLTVFMVLIIVTGAIATSYYLCFWRGGRLGYRPSRDLLNKY